MNRTRLPYVYAGLAVFFWSTIPTAFKIGLGELDTLTFLTIATITSTTVLFILLISGHKLGILRETTRKELFSSAFLGLLNPFVYYIILLRAYRLLPGQVAQPLNMIWPIVLVFLSVPLLKQSIPGRSFLSLFISFAGVYIVSSQGHPFKPGSSNPEGVLLATGSSFFWALYFIFNVKDKRDESVKLFTNFLFASLFFIIALIFKENRHPVISTTGFATALYAGLFEMGITFFFWLKALQLAKTSDKISNMVYLAPFVSLLFLYFIINEHVYYTTPIGLIIIITGIYIQNRRSKIFG